MSIIRRTGVGLILLGLVLPVTSAPVAAHVGAGWEIEWGFRTDEAGVVVSGLVINHTSTRQTNIMVTATWRIGGSIVASETTAAFIDSLALHSASPFKLTESQDVTGATLTVTATGTPTFVQPDGALGVEPGVLTDDTYNGTVRNESDLPAQNVRVFAVRRQGSIAVDAAASNTIANLPAGASAAYTINFDDFTGTVVSNLSAETSGGTNLHTSWNNWFNDLGTSSFLDEIAFLADEGISFGCATQKFCPKSAVTREQMAVFLDRALDLPAATGDHPFTDLDDRPQRVRDAVASLYEAGITGGCTATTFCPLAAVTRGQMSKFIVLGYELAPIAGPGPFTDDNGHFSEPYNNRMAADGITSGCGVGAYCPHAMVLREQMAKFLFEAET